MVHDQIIPRKTVNAHAPKYFECIFPVIPAVVILDRCQSGHAALLVDPSIIPILTKPVIDVPAILSRVLPVILSLLGCSMSHYSRLFIVFFLKLPISVWVVSSPFQPLLIVLFLINAGVVMLSMFFSQYLSIFRIPFLIGLLALGRSTVFFLRHPGTIWVDFGSPLLVVNIPTWRAIGLKSIRLGLIASKIREWFLQSAPTTAFHRTLRDPGNDRSLDDSKLGLQEHPGNTGQNSPEDAYDQHLIGCPISLVFGVLVAVGHSGACSQFSQALSALPAR